MAATDSKIRWWYADSYLKPIEKQPCQFISCWSLQRQQEVLVATCLASKRGWWERTSLLSFSPWDYKKISMLLAFLYSRIIFFLHKIIYYVEINGFFFLLIVDQLLSTQSCLHHPPFISKLTSLPIELNLTSLLGYLSIISFWTPF